MTSNRRQLLTVLWACLAIAAFATHAAAAERRDLLAHGATGFREPSDAPLWLVYNSPTEERSTVRTHPRLSDRQWIELPAFQSRIHSITAHSTEAVVVLKPVSGPVRDWAWLSADRFSYGPLLPNCGIIAMAGDRQSLWALGRPLSPRAPQTRAADTRPAATRPATLPVQEEAPILFRYLQGDWQRQDIRWPADLPPQATLSMAVVVDQPTLAVLTADRQIQILQPRQNQWQRLSTIKPSVKVGFFKLLALDRQPAVWCQPADSSLGIGGIHDGDRYIKLDLSTAVRPVDVDVTVGGDDIRVFYRTKEDKEPREQRFSTTGRPAGEPVTVQSVGLEQSNQTQWIVIAAAALAVVLILNALLRRRAATDRRDDRDNSDDE